MNPWPFVIAAYAVTIAGTGVLLVASFAAMRRAESEADELRNRK